MKELDFTGRNVDGFIEGVCFKKYRDGEVLVKVFFEGLSRSEGPRQDEAHAWLSEDQVIKLINILRGRENV